MSSFPKNTPQSDILDIIVSTDGNLEAIERKVQEYWENGAQDEWTTVQTRSEKVLLFSLFHFREK